MKKNTELNKLIKIHGSQAKAARAIGCTEVAISQVVTGKREMPKLLAKTIVDKFPQISLYALLYPGAKAA